MKSIQVTITLPEDLVLRAKEHAGTTGKTFSRLVGERLKAALPARVAATLADFPRNGRPLRKKK